MLPSDLAVALKRLSDREFNRLIAAVNSEQKRRGGKHSALDESTRKRRIETVAVPLTISKINAVRAAFKAGVTPSRISRQFGIPQSEVRKALSGDQSKS